MPRVAQAEAPTGKPVAARRGIPEAWWSLRLRADDIAWEAPGETLLRQAHGIPGMV